MNCRFCNNFIPDDSKICPICGKDVSEPVTAAIIPQNIPTPNLEPVAPAENEPVRVVAKKRLLTPAIILIIGLAALAYLFLPSDLGGTGVGGYGAIDHFQEDIKAISDAKDAESGDEGDISNQTGDVGSKTSSEGFWKDLGLVSGSSLLGGAVAIGGGAMLGKRAKHNSKVNKMTKNSK